MKRRRFVVLDRDGTVIHERHYLADPAEVELVPGAAAGLRRFRELGFGLVMITNQSGIGRGYFDEEALAQIHARLAELLGKESVQLDGIYFCPHVPEHGCACRKPRPGLLQRAAAELDFDPRDALVIGDKPCDIELGKAVGAVSLLVRTGYGVHVEAEGGAGADFVADGLLEAAELAERHLLNTEVRK